jgi:hypothetical protein
MQNLDLKEGFHLEEMKQEFQICFIIDMNFLNIHFKKIQ